MADGLEVVRSQTRLPPDPCRTITKPFIPGDYGPTEGRSRVIQTILRVLAMSPDEVDRTLRDVKAAFAPRHRDFDDVLIRGFAAVAHAVPNPAELADNVCRLIGAYFMHEYSIEAAALTNPSMVLAPDQDGVPNGAARVIISLRAVGEGHLSSIEFRTGLIREGGDIEVEPPGAAIIGTRRSALFVKALFTAKLEEIGADPDLVRYATEGFDDRFTMADLEAGLAELEVRDGASTAVHQVTQQVHWLASSNYEVAFPSTSALSQRVLFPGGPSESHGMEDSRLVRFEEADGAVVYYATYTAYDGFSVLPQLIETADFQTFRIATLNGLAARNKGIALFPRRIGGKYAALARSDGESNYLMLSDHVRFWHDADRIQVPAHPWELMQIGNSGSPIETEAGWLVITHGVGPMRQYALGAILLDLDDPHQVIGHLREPIMVPSEDERDGYVPNVVYSCGSVVHDDHLVIAYGAADTSTGFAKVPLDTLLSTLTSGR